MDEFFKTFIVVLIVIFIVLLVVDFATPTYGFFAKVNAGNVGIVTHFGKIEDKVLQAGFHFTGFFEQVHPVNIRTQKVDGELVAFSSDIQQVTMKVAINYNITPDVAYMLYKTIGNDYLKTLMVPRISEDVKVVASKYTAEKLIANREALSPEILTLLGNDLQTYGITVTAVSVENIDFSDTFEAAVEEKQVATQKRQKTQTEQEEQTMIAEQEAKRQKIQAEVEAEVEKTRADADAYATKAKADAEAEANKKVSSTITRDLIDYLQAQRWDGKLPGIVGSSDALPIVSVTP